MSMKLADFKKSSQTGNGRDAPPKIATTERFGDRGSPARRAAQESDRKADK